MTRLLWLSIAALCMATSAAAFFHKAADAPATVTLRIAATAENAPLVFDQFLYDNPGGAGQFAIRDFRFYLSNIVFEGGGDRFVQPQSYHLARFDARSGVIEIAVPDVPLPVIDRVSLGVGLDPAANKTIAPLGDVDPNSRMAWNWAIGYKCLLIEGALRGDAGLMPLVYHVGFDENYRALRFDLAEPVTVADGAMIPFVADLMAVFGGAPALDLSALPTVKMDRTDAAMLADNYAAMLRLDL